MGAKALISPEEYLAMRFEWEPEYVHGELRERPLPDRVHARMESRLAILLGLLERQNAVGSFTNLRCRLAADVYRLPDVALLHNKPFENVPTIPPIMVAEILSRDDAMVDVEEKAAEYAEWGVKNIWLVNPWRRRLQVWNGDQFTTVSKFELPEFGWNCTIDDLMEGIPADALKR
jgi:Uma2 family endonuclease